MNVSPITFQFSERKAAQAAAFLVKRFAGGVIDRLALIKLLYYAEREFLGRYGRPIFGDRYYSLDHGPIVSRILDLIREDTSDPDNKDRYWHKYIRRGTYPTVVLGEDPGEDDLAPVEIDTLNRVIDANKGKSAKQIEDESHQLPEYKNPNGSSLPISVEDILVALGKSSSDISRMAQDVGVRATLHDLFRTPASGLPGTANSK